MGTKMKMQLFGTFVLYGQDKALDENRLHSNKLVRLLVYMLIYRDRVLSHQDLINVFWEDDSSKNPLGALKNLMYRLRNELKIFGDEELILTLPGAYRWNPEIEVETDYEQFEQLVNEARKESDNRARKMILCEEATSCYKRNVSPRIADEDWMLPFVTFYQSVYMDTAKMLAQMYEEEQEWKKLESFVTKVQEVDALDEDIHYWMIKSQIGQNNYDLAMRCYEKSTALFYDHFGIRDIERFNQAYEEILSLANNHKKNISEILQAVCEEEEPRGAFFCEYPVFREIYRVEARRIHRTGVAEYLLLITLRRSNSASKEEEKDDGIKQGMMNLGKLLDEFLRTGDVVARYISTQYILLLPTCSYETAQIVIERIKKKFHEAIGKRRLELQFELEEMSLS